MAPSPQLIIRSYVETDRDVVVNLWRACNLIVPWNDPVRDIEAKLEVQRDLFLVGVIGGKIVATAMVGYNGHRGRVNYLGSEPARACSPSAC